MIPALLTPWASAPSLATAPQPPNRRPIGGFEAASNKQGVLLVGVLKRSLGLYDRVTDFRKLPQGSICRCSVPITYASAFGRPSSALILGILLLRCLDDRSPQSWKLLPRLWFVWKHLPKPTPKAQIVPGSRIQTRLLAQVSYPRAPSAEMIYFGA